MVWYQMSIFCHESHHSYLMCNKEQIKEELPCDSFFFFCLVSFSYKHSLLRFTAWWLDWHESANQKVGFAVKDKLFCLCCLLPAGGAVPSQITEVLSNVDLAFASNFCTLHEAWTGSWKACGWRCWQRQLWSSVQHTRWGLASTVQQVNISKRME